MIAASPTHLTRNRKQTVLIVDNDTALAEAIATTLDIDGLQTIVSHSGEEALALARAFHPDLILLDVMLPERSGIEVCATLKTDPSTSSIPVIFVTAKAEESDRLVGLAAGADEYITKPFSPTELLLVVNEILSGRSEQFSGFRRRGAKIADLAGVADDQLVVFAHEWKELFERERRERWALEEAHQRLGELDRLKAAFLSAVTHELMTPFASIGITLQVLKQGREQLLPDQQEALDNLSDEITNLHRLVNGVVKFAELVNKRREPQPQFVALRDIIPQALQPVLMMARSRGIEFEIVLPVDLPGVYADPDLLSEAIFQMAHNAVKFNVPGGHVWLEPTNPKGWVVIQVRDTGVGLTPQRLELLGQPFEQEVDAVQRGREGLGIGWAFVRYVADVHGGWVRAESEGPGRGSTFSIALPMIAGWHVINLESLVSDGDGVGVGVE